MTSIYHEYLIIGAGPGGLQLAYYLHQNKRDYLILDRGEKAGSFFTKFPRHRKIISINKQYLGVLSDRPGVDEDEVRLRFDWNSLLSTTHQPVYRDYSQDYFPHADTMPEYLGAYQEQHDLHFRHNTSIIKIICPNNESEFFHLTDQDSKVYTTKYLIMATGLSKPNIPSDIPGIELATGYEEMSLDLDKYKNKSIAILGKGNSAFETADYLTPVAGNIKLLGTHSHKNAWQTHFVGDLRAINNNYLDTYQLKSLNVIEEWDDHSIQRSPTDPNKLLYRNDADIQFDYVIRCLGWKFDDTAFTDIKPELFEEKLPKIKANYESTNISRLYFAGTLIQSRDYKKSTGAFIHGFRYAARSLASMFELEHHNKPYPRKTYELTFDELTKRTLDLANESSSIFQMFEHYCHLVVLRGTHFDIYQDMPKDYLSYLKDDLREYNFFVMTMEYGFKEGEDVFNYSFINYERYNGYNSRFIHPVIRFYPKREMQPSQFQQKTMQSRLTIEKRLEAKWGYTLCICGRWEELPLMQEQTRCRLCQPYATCTCGQEESLEWLKTNKTCRNHDKKDQSSTDKDTFSLLVTDELFYFEHHITEDVHNNFKSGKETHDLFYYYPLRRFFRTIVHRERVNTIPFYHAIWKSGTQKQAKYHKYKDLPVQFRFWTFFSYLIPETPDHREAEVVKISPRSEIIMDLKYSESISEALSGLKKSFA